MTSRRWFHQNITGQEAEQLLMERGRDGSFLCRPSSTNKKDFTLSVRRNNSVTHIKIQNHGDYYDLPGGEPFSTLSELIQYYMERELREKNGELIELLYPLNCKDPTSERWFHGHMSSKVAERLMLDKGKNGSYLVRESVSKPGDYVLTIKSDDSVLHVMIYNVDGKYDIGGGPVFETITDLVDYYRQNPMVEKNGGTVVHLKQPFNATKITASSIGDRVVELQRETPLVPNKDGFWEEFEQLQQQECKHRYSRKVGLSSENKIKNRFKNIVPFDHTRVELLDGDPDDPIQDYINASYVKGESDHEYIATQGPLAETIHDFWRMVYQENSCVILMITREIERGKSRCAKYWPDVDSSMEVENFTIFNSKETETQEFIYRELKLTNRDEPEEGEHTIYHYQYIGWPEHGTPSNVGSVIGILHDINLKQKSNNYPGPIVAHCSSGIGRTAAFLVIDILVKILQKQGLDCEIDVQKTVQHVRTQRAGMVQLEAQYKFIYLAIAHYVEMEHNFRSMSPPGDVKMRCSTSKRTPDTPSERRQRPPPLQMSSSDTPPPIVHRVPPKPPVIAVNGELPPAIPHRKPASGLPMTNLLGRPPPKEEEPNTPPPIPTRKK